MNPQFIKPITFVVDFSLPHVYYDTEILALKDTLIDKQRRFGWGGS